MNAIQGRFHPTPDRPPRRTHTPPMHTSSHTDPPPQAPTPPPSAEMTRPSVSTSKIFKRTYWEHCYNESKNESSIHPPRLLGQRHLALPYILIKVKSTVLLLLPTRHLVSRYPRQASAVFQTPVSSRRIKVFQKEKSHFLTFLRNGGRSLLQSCDLDLGLPPARPTTGIGAGGGIDKIS